MKNQYVGDIGDYGKYGLLRFIAAHNIRIGILTLKKEFRVRNFFSKTNSRMCGINCNQKVTEIFQQTGEIILQVYLQAGNQVLYSDQ